jgi:hypothetical protein
MKIFQKLGSKNYWYSTLIIILSVMLFKGLVGDLINKYLHLNLGIIYDFIILLIIITIVRLITEEIFEVN